MDLSVARNIVADAARGRSRKGGLIRSAAENALATDWGGQLQVKTTGSTMPSAPCRGGNQQKVVIAKWLATEPEAADHRRAHPRHRRRHQGRGPPAAVRARRPGPRDPDDLLRAARGARHGRPRAGLCEGRITAELSRAEADEESVDARRHRSASARSRHERRRRRSRAPAPRADRPSGCSASASWASSLVLVLLIAVTGILEPRFLEAAALRNLRSTPRSSPSSPPARRSWSSPATSTCRSARCSASARISPATCCPAPGPAAPARLRGRHGARRGLSGWSTACS